VNKVDAQRLTLWSAARILIFYYYFGGP